ncbi:hypothetical protein [Nocardia thraciensis]
MIAGIGGTVSGLFWLLTVHMVLESRLSSDPAVDPHGYAMIFGTIMAVPMAAVTGLGLVAAVPRAHRAPAAGIVIPILVLTTFVLFVAVATE